MPVFICHPTQKPILVLIGISIPLCAVANVVTVIARKTLSERKQNKHGVQMKMLPDSLFSMGLPAQVYRFENVINQSERA